MKKRTIIIISCVICLVAASIAATIIFHNTKEKKTITNNIVTVTTTTVKTTTKEVTEETINTTTSQTTQKQTEHVDHSDEYYSASYFRNMGEIYWNGWRWTWYSEKVLPGGGLNIHGRHNDSDGYVCDENGYICLASSSLDYGTIISTPLGKQGKIYDSGFDYNTIDVYVGW